MVIFTPPNRTFHPIFLHSIQTYLYTICTICTKAQAQNRPKSRRENTDLSASPNFHSNRFLQPSNKKWYSFKHKNPLQSKFKHIQNLFRISWLKVLQQSHLKHRRSCGWYIVAQNVHSKMSHGVDGGYLRGNELMNRQKVKVGTGCLWVNEIDDSWCVKYFSAAEEKCFAMSFCGKCMKIVYILLTWQIVDYVVWYSWVSLWFCVLNM